MSMAETRTEIKNLVRQAIDAAKQCYVNQDGMAWADDWSAAAAVLEVLRVESGKLPTMRIEVVTKWDVR